MIVKPVYFVLVKSAYLVHILSLNKIELQKILNIKYYEFYLGIKMNEQKETHKWHYKNKV